ncbi:Sodium/calcium exchanger membrane region [Penicillium angulare]|uniref:Sodium/calcium exchanger membrane region n=1 Tax=Penicillium angulare TaxID=116970 RepID=A0A9W9GDM4_9EURO|nr:Sodium/calcium exchanger membrane region [Penicillium angulare]
MVRDGHLEADEQIDTTRPFHDNSVCGDESHLIDDCGSSIHSGNRSRARQWGINQNGSIANASDNLSRHVKEFFHSSRPRSSTTTSMPRAVQCDACDKPRAAFKRKCKDLITSKNLISIPFALVAIFVSLSNISPLVIFIGNLIAIVPLSITLTLATEQLSQELGETAGALLNITVGNLAELIIFVTALMKDNIRVVQASLLGSILVNLLLVLGSAIIAGGLKSADLTYNSDLTHAFIGLLNLTVSCLMIPTAFYGSVKSVKSADDMSLNFSRGVSVILLCIYFLYLFFQFRSHAHLFRSSTVPLQVNKLASHRPSRRSSYDQMFIDIESQSDTESESESLIGKSTDQPEMQQIQSPGPSSPMNDIRPDSAVPLGDIDTTPRTHTHTRHRSWHAARAETTDETDTHHCKYMSLANRITAIVLLVASTALIAICAEFFASSFEILNEKGVLGESFVGLIVIPVAGNVAENVTAVIVASKNQLDLAISVALGSAIQIGLLVAPVIVLAAWALDKPMTLHFDRFGMVTLVGSALLVSFLVLKGKTNYLEGAILCACFAAISVGAFLLPIN